MPVWTDKYYNYAFPWNKSISHMDYFLTLCPDVCYEEEKINLAHFTRCSSMNCFPCDCQKPRCLIYGTCCPEVHSPPENFYNSADPPDVNLSSLLLSKEVATTTNRTTNISCSNNFLLLRSCPDDFSDLRVRQWCEEDLLGQDMEYDKNLMDVLTKVSDPVTGVTYYNKYCAECNNVTNVTPWSIRIDCLHYLYVYKAINALELLRLSLDKASTCKVKDQIPEPNSTYATCDDNFWFERVIGDCNLTGKWTHYDPDVARLCLQTTGHSFSVVLSHMYYPNVFCALCNSDIYPSLKNDCFPLRSFPLVVPPFTVLLNFYEKSLSDTLFKTEKRICPKEKWSGPGNRCFLIKCADGKQLKNGQCLTALSEIRGLGYQVRLEYLLNFSVDYMQTFSQSNSQLYFLSNSLTQWFKIHLFEICKELSFNLIVRSSHQNNVTFIDVQTERVLINPFLLSLDIYVITQKNITRDVAESILTQRLFQNNLTLLVGGNLLTLEYVNSPLYKWNRQNVSTVNGYCETLMNISFPDSKSIDNMWASKEDFLWLDELLMCPFVHFNNTRVHVETLVSADTSTKYMVRIDLDDAVFVFTEKDELKKLSLEEDGAVNICVNLLDSKLVELQEKLQAAEASESLYVITVICLGVSMVCLLITVVTYISFRTLRSVAGIHTMILSGTLLLAQALLLMISHVQAPSITCTVLGVSTHFMWLCMFAWSLICCFHMYTIFTANRNIVCNTRQFLKQLILKLVFSLLIPALIVSMVIVVDYIVSNGQRMGYGTRTCYLNSKELILCSVAAPLGAVLLSNVFFFVSSVLEIYKLRNFQSTKMFKKSDRSNLYIYMKLSTMTGVFWLLALLAEGLDNNVLRYISVVMNGLQGMFIFMSYVCNKRVWTLYKQCLSGPPLLEFNHKDKGTFSQSAFEVQAKKDMCHECRGNE
nr:adhesion G protein-coupled receptor E2-like [Biomphalaria glabrata]